MKATIISLSILMVTGVLLLVMAISAEASPSKQTTLVVDYSNVLTAGFVAQELGLNADRVAVVDVVLCDVTFNLPLRVDQDEHNGQLVRTREVNELSLEQQRRLDELMGAQGCFRSR